MISISTTGIDQLTRAFVNIDELKQFRNGTKSQIKELEFIARDPTHEQRCTVSMSADGDNNVTFSIDAREDVAVRLNGFFEDFFEAVRPWYSSIAKAKLDSLLVGVMLTVGAIIFLILLVSGRLSKIDWAEATSDGKAEAFMYGILIMLATTLLNSIKSRYFPMGVFSIGDGVRRQERLEKIQSGVIVSFVVSIAASCVMLLF